MNPLSLIKNIPSPEQRWKLPVREWIDELYEAGMGKPVRKAEPLAGSARLSPDIDYDLVMDMEDIGGVPFDEELMDELSRENEPPDEAEIAEQRRLLLERQEQFVQAAEWVARELSTLPQVKRVVLFGSVANPLAEDVPRFRRFRRWRIAVPHECGDVDLVVWMNDLSGLRSVQKTMRRALDALANAEDFHVAPHQIDMFLHDSASGAYAGRLCPFATCPKGKPECDVDGCGRIPHLQYIEGFVMRPDALSPGHSRVLFDREAANAGERAGMKNFGVDFFHGRRPS